MSSTGQARRPTLRDVADRAGVSISTASLVYSGKRAVAPTTAARVVAAAEELGYGGPDPLASSLRQGRAGVVGVHLEGTLGYAFADPYAVSVLDGLAQVLDAMALGMLLLPQHPGGSSGVSATLDGQALDAVVFALCGPEESVLVDRLAARGVPMIGTGSPADPRVTQVRVDERAASSVATRHVRDLGHERIGHVTMPLHARGQLRVVADADIAAATYPDTRLRAQGFRDVAGPGALVVESAGLTVDDAAAAGHLLLDRPDPPTAIVCQSDLIAAGVVRAAGERGLTVPVDLSVVGYDGVALPWFPGTLTTIDQDGPAKGRRLGELVRRRLAGEQVDDEVHPTTLRVGTTTAPRQV